MPRAVTGLIVLMMLVGLFAVSAPAEAGTIYSSQAAFDAAVGSGPSWTEDFEGFSTGSVADPLLIAGGSAEVVDGGNASIISALPTKVWLQGGGTDANATIRGAGNTSLGLYAISFYFGNEVSQTVNFVTNLGTDTSGEYAGNGGTTDRFVGWIASPGETLGYARFVQTQGITLDNVRGFAPVPEPTSLALFGLGVAGLAVARRRKRQTA